MQNQQKQIESYDTHLAHSVKSSLVPSWVEVLLYLLSGSLVLCILNYRVFLNNLGAGSGVSESVLSNYLQGKLTNVSDFASGLLQGRVATMLFWAFIGSIIYMVIWTFQNLVINIENDVRAGEFVGVQNTSAKKHAHWNSVISSKIFFVCSLLVFIIYTLSLAKFLLPLTSKAFSLSITNFTFPQSLFGFSLSIVVTSLLLFLFVLSLKITARAWHWIINNF